MGVIVNWFFDLGGFRSNLKEMGRVIWYGYVGKLFEWTGWIRKFRILCLWCEREGERKGEREGEGGGESRYLSVGVDNIVSYFKEIIVIIDR